MIEFIDDEGGEEVSISNVADWMRFNTPVESKSNDPFKIQGEDLTKVSGLGASFRRKMNRDLQKRFQGIDGTETQQNLLAQAITGYAMFDLIEPPYNLDYLSQIYEISPYNYAAINAKVSNIVGLGHDFVETRKTQEAFDNITDGQKVIVCKLKQNPLGFTSVAYPVDELRLPQWFKDLPFDHDEMEATIIDNKLENLIGVLNWDIKSTEEKNTFNSLFEF